MRFQRLVFPFVTRAFSILTAKQAYAAVLVFAVVASLAFTSRVNGVAKTWDGGCGADTSWSCANNWSDNVVPSNAADTLTFNATSTNNSTIDAAWTQTNGVIATITISSGYTGTITMARSLQLTGAYSQSAGSFTAADQTLDMNSTFTLSAGNFTASSATTTLAGAMTVTGTPAFSNNSGIWTFDGTTTATLSCGILSFNTVTFAHTSGTKTVSSNCNLPLGANPTIPNALTLNGQLNGSGTLAITTGTFTVSHATPLTGFTGLTAGAAVTVTGTSNHLDLSTFSTVDINGALTISTSAALTAPTGVMTIGGSMTQNSGTTFNHNGGTVNFDTGTATITCQGSPFNLVSLTAGSKTIAAGCTVPLGNNPTIVTTSTVTVTGTLSGSGTITFPGAATFNGSSPLSGFSGLVHSASNFTVSSGGVVDLSSYTTVDINGAFLLNSGGTFTAPSGVMTAATTFTHSSGGTFNHSNGLVRFDGGGGNITCQGSPFYQAEITTGTKTVVAGCTIPLGANPTLGVSLTVSGAVSGSGVLTFTTGTLTFSAGGGVSGFSDIVASGLTISGSGTVNMSSLSSLDINSTFTLSSPAVFSAPPLITAAGSVTLNSGATFTHNNGTIRFDGTGNGTITCNGITLYNVEFRHAASGIKTVASTCNLPLGTNPTIDYSVTLQGTLSGSGTLTFSAGTLTLNNAAASFSGFSTVAPNALTSSGAITLDLSSMMSTLDINSTFTQSTSGNNFTPPPTMRVAGNFTLATGTVFNHNNGTVVLDGQSQDISGSVTFNNLTKQNSSTDYAAIRFANSSTTTILGALTLEGNSSAYLGLTMNGGTSWNIDPQGSRDIEYVSVMNSINVSSTPIDAVHSLSGPGNSNWAFTEPVSSAGNTIDFEDATASAAIDDDMVGMYAHSAAWGDANGDGYIDLYVGSFGDNSVAPADSMLLLGSAAGTFTKSEQPAIQLDGRASGTVFVDLDNDGDEELVVSNYTKPADADPTRALPSYVFENIGSGVYADITIASGFRDAISASTGRNIGVLDYNNDGYQDLIAHADALVGGIGTLKLVKNNGNLTFTNVTAEAGIATNISGLGLAVGDANGDSWSDFVFSGAVYAGSGNNFRDFYLYISNQDGTFRDASSSELNWPVNGGVDDWAAGANWGDLNNDGRLDLVTTQHYESAYKVAPLSMRVYINKGNDGSGNPILDRMPISTLVPIGAKQPHVELQDFDNDGWVDIFTSVFTQVGSDLRPYVYRNSGVLDGSGEPSFIPPTYDYLPPIPTLTIPYYSPGAPSGDYNNDGKLDIFMQGLGEFASPTLWRNSTGGSNNWLKVSVAGETNTQGIGTVIKAYQAGHAGDANYLLATREISTGNGYSSAQPTIAHFGLGAYNAVDIVATLPNGGGTFTRTGINANQAITLEVDTETDPTPDSPLDPGQPEEAATTVLPKSPALPEVVADLAIELPTTGQDNNDQHKPGAISEPSPVQGSQLPLQIAIGAAALAVAGVLAVALVPQVTAAVVAITSSGAATSGAAAGGNALLGPIKKIGRLLLKLLGKI